MSLAAPSCPSPPSAPRPARRMRPHAAKAAALLKSIGNEQRLMILCNLLDGPMSVGMLRQRMSLSQSALSQHLAVLREAGAVATRRRSQSIIYSVPPGTVTGIITLLQQRYCPAGPRSAGQPERGAAGCRPVGA